MAQQIRLNGCLHLSLHQREELAPELLGALPQIGATRAYSERGVFHVLSCFVNRVVFVYF